MIHDVSAVAKSAAAIDHDRMLGLVISALRSEIAAVNHDVDAAGAKLRLVWRLQRERLLLREVSP